MPDPCQIFVDAVAASEAEIADLLESLDSALTLLDERLAALADCRDQNPEPGGGGGQGFTAQKTKISRGKERVMDLKKLFPKKK